MNSLKKTKKLIAILLALISFAIMPVFACGGDYVDNGLRVIFIDVEEGDAIFIKYPDGKRMLIDTGEPIQRIKNSVVDVIEKNGGLDYLLITHTDSDHIGNAVDIVTKYQVEKVFLPRLTELNLFENYTKLLTVIESNQIELIYFDSDLFFTNGRSVTSFLSPIPSGIEGSAIDEINLASSPTQLQINDVSPIVYLEYKGVTFLFTGDASARQERLVLERVKEKFSCKSVTENLRKIDFLKVSHHGADNASCEEFLKYTRPRNAIISVGADNNYGYPCPKVVQRLVNSYNKIKLYRTDLLGNITVDVTSNGKYAVTTQRTLDQVNGKT